MTERFHTTVTERGDFRSCRRRWHLGTVERLAPKDRVFWNLIFGNCMHSALEAYYKNKFDLYKAQSAFVRAWNKEDAVLQETYMGLYSHGIDVEWAEYRVKAELMLEYYHIYDRQSDWWKGTEILEVAVETREFVDILNPYELDADGETPHQIEGHPLLSGKIDLVLKRKDGIHIWDHKTAASAYDARALDVDDQLTGYNYIWWRHTGEVPKSSSYNALIKSPPSPPRILKDGSISKAKDQRTTYDIYRVEMKRLGIPHNDPDYDEILNVLQEKGWSQFFLRDTLMKTEEEMVSFERRLYNEYQDMQDAIANPEDRAYPNPSQQNCPGCAVVPICQTMEEQGDVEGVVENMYVVSPPRTQIPKAILHPNWKGV